MQLKKNGRQWMAWLIIISFIFTAQLSAAPRTEAKDKPTTISTGHDETGAPGSFELEGSEHKAGNRWLLPVLIGVVAVGAIVLVLYLLRTKYDITGIWTFSVSTGFDFLATLTGSKTSGNVVWNDSVTDWPGVYDVSGTSLTLTIITEASLQVDFTGKIKDNDHMSGTFLAGNGMTGTWTALRGDHRVTAAAGPGPRAAWRMKK